jgi:tetratricopeptide (TPR) repeat protein
VRRRFHGYHSAYLPLTIRIAAEQAATRIGVGLVDLAEELAVEKDRLSAFATADDDEMTEVRNVLSWSYGALTPEAARMFRLIGLHAGPDISLPAASALAGVPVGEARHALRSLTAVNMLEESARERFLFHDLLRAYAIERAEAEESDADRTSALHRELMWYLHTADAADRVFAPRRRHVPLGPPGPDWRPLAFEQYDDAVAWCEAERPNLLAALDQAVAMGADEVAWKLPVALVTFFYLRSHRANRLTTTLIAVDAARRAEDRYGQAWSLICVGGAFEDLRRFEEAIDSYEKSLAICREIADRQGEGMSLENLASSHREIGRDVEALEFGQRALAIWREIDDRRNEGITLCTLGDVSFDLGQLDAAADFYSQALPVCHETDRHSEGRVLHAFGNVHQKLGNIPDAIAYYERALLLRREIGDRFGEAETSHQLGRALREADQPAAARRAFAEALAIFDNLADPAADTVRQQLDELESDTGEHDQG